MSDGVVGRFARWSQRKHAARQSGRGRAAPMPLADDNVAGEQAAIEGAGDAPAVDGLRQPTADQGSAPPSQESASQAPADGDQAREDIVASLTPVEELTAESDYTQFLADGVPQALRNAALRKLWASDPVFAVLDGLNDYDEDFNLTDRIISAADTNYKVGRGFLDDAEPEPEDREPRPETAEPSEPAQVADGNPEASDPAAGSEREVATGDGESGPPVDEPNIEVAAGGSDAGGDDGAVGVLGKKSQASNDDPPEPA